uniref:Uncharacterized protein n=1 Tax=Anguilla anguilla TaxID=7936 RepID=A0A0E9Q740_ANGAN
MHLTLKCSGSFPCYCLVRTELELIFRVRHFSSSGWHLSRFTEIFLQGSRVNKSSNIYGQSMLKVTVFLLFC